MSNMVGFPLNHYLDFTHYFSLTFSRNSRVSHMSPLQALMTVHADYICSQLANQQILANGTLPPTWISTIQLVHPTTQVENISNSSNM
jgi:hypothetical protein